ncbi:peroxisomal dehydratase [Vararia minispora EC-137]|uniref:Peroxisomal dehydratase n=1 Tax=Vararia minispora EC-137 TaxID=1314806 RepID=A0ACB8QFT7_9AGAM|nr:peroxisomal dehydratase [Vararia minispora EC-137]
MAAELENVIGYQYPDQPVTWTKRDILTYAVGIGAKSTDLQFVYELDPNFSVFPTYPAVLALKKDAEDVTLFSEIVKSRDGPAGLPKFDPNRVVHGSQSVEILKPLPVESGPGWVLKQRLTSLQENKSGVIVESEYTLVGRQGTTYAKLFSSSFNLGAKITGDRFSKIIDGPPKGVPIPEDRKPDWLVHDQTTPEQALVYRLSGDYNPLHIDPKIGQAAGFGGVILHGLSTFGFGARALLSAIGGNDPSALKYYGVRFTAPVKPGDGLEISAWEVGSRADGTSEITFQVKNLATGKVVLGNGLAYIRKAESSKL